MRAPTADAFTSRLRSPAVAARVGLWLGVCFGICFLTGLVSHYAQLPSQPIPFPTSPSWGYRLTQGLHVTTGIAAIPLLLVKLWSVLPNLFQALPSLGDPRAVLLNVLERGSIAVLVAASVFQLATGVANAAQWYPWFSFSFRTVHYALAWVAIGALLVHIAVKLPIIRDVLTSDIDATTHDRPSATQAGALSRRALVRTSFAAAGVAVLATAGNTVPWLRKVSVFAVRTGEGPGGVPINKSARAARVEDSATSSDWRLEIVVGGAVAQTLTLRRPAGDAAAHRRPADRVRGGLERPGHLVGRPDGRPARRRRHLRRGRRGHLPPAVRPLPHHEPPGRLRRRRAHPARPRPVR